MEVQPSTFQFLESDAPFESTFRNSPIGMVLSDPDTSLVLEVNQVFLAALGRSRDELVGKPVPETKIWRNLNDRTAVKKLVEEAGEVHAHPISWMKSDHNERKALISANFVVVGGRKCFLVQVLDTTERIRVEHELADMKKHFDFVFSNSPLPMTITDATSLQFLAVSPAVEKLFGYSREELVGKTFVEIGHWVSVDERDKLLKELRAKHRVLGRELKFMSKSGNLLFVRASYVQTIWADKDVFISTLEDMTAARQAEERNKAIEKELNEAKRLEALGVLAGGIAHDFNNILSSITANIDLLRLKDRLDGVPLTRLEAIGSASLRARDLIRRILSFSRQSALNRKIVSIVPTIREALDLLSGSVPSNIEVTLNAGSSIPNVEVDTSQIHEVILNLGNNAIHAIGDTSGRIQVNVQTGVSSAGQEVVEVVFKDTGKGIASDVLPRVFEPYFSTKSHEVGTGLGLAVVHGIVKDHGGSVSVESAPGEGTTFVLRFPAAGVSANVGVEKEELLKFGSGETVLLVDDEPSVLESTGALLEFLGYSVVQHSSAKDALEALFERPGTIDLVLTDFSMPLMSGIDLSRRVFEAGSRVPVVLMTGYANACDEQLQTQAGLSGCLSKPISSNELSLELRRVLEIRRLGKSKPL